MIADALERVARGDLRRLAVFMPPRHGKSELCSVRFPAWFLGNYPDKRIIHASYGGDLSSDFGRQVRNLIDSDEYEAVFPEARLASDSKRVDNWNLAAPHRGGMRSAGVGSGITGRGAHLLIIDDPIKSAQDAESAIKRESTWTWYVRDAYTRLEEKAAIVLVMTRWHKDDLAGRLLERMQDGTGEPWEVLHLPAIDSEGRALWPEKYPLSVLENIRRNDLRTWEALYQGNPRPSEGAMFKQGWFPYVDAAPAEVLMRIRWWDKAASEGYGDWTVGALLSRTAEGLFFVEDVVRGQWSTGTRDSVIKETAERDRQQWGASVWTTTEQEPGSGGKDAVQAFTKLLAGYRILKIEPASGDKTVRAQPFASQCEAGNVRLVRGKWNRAFVDEHMDFPFGAHDDQVDAAASGFNKLAQYRPHGGIHL